MIDVIKAAPRFVSEYLQLEYAQKMRDIHSDLIFRNVTVSNNFTLSPTEQEQDQAKVHDHMAGLKRKEQEAEFINLNSTQQNYIGTKKNVQLKISQIREITEKFNNEESKDKEKMLKMATFPPIIFEECYVKDGDEEFVSIVKQATNELSE